MMLVAKIAGIKHSRGITRFKLKLMIENIRGLKVLIFH